MGGSASAASSADAAFVPEPAPSAVGHPYRRYLVNQLRQAYGFVGSPLRLALRAHRSKRKAQPKARE